MKEGDIVKSLSETRKPRVTIYLNEEGVNDLYVDRVGAITELVRTDKINARVSASLWGLFGSELGGGQELAGNLTITPVLKAILAEYQARDSGELVDLGNDVPRPKSLLPPPQSLLTYIGAGQFVDIDDKATPHNTGLSSIEAKTIQDERELQQTILQREDKSIRTIVWLASPRGHRLASIASSKWIKWGPFASYGRRPPFGLLGRHEGIERDIQFISPFWLWHDQW